MNITKGPAPLSVQFTSLSSNANSWNWDFENDGHIDSTDPNPIYIYTTPGTYTVSLKVSNKNETASKTVIIDVLDKSSSSDSSDNGGSSSGGSSHHSSSGGSGGAGGSPEPQSNVEVKELSQIFVASGKSVKFEFPRNATSVVSLSFDSKKTAGKTTTIVENLKGKSTLVTGLPSDEIYKYINIWVGNSGFATSKNIENAVVNFKVEKSWIQDKNIDKSSITLNRYNDKKWNQLPASLSGEDDKYLYFTAKTQEFSYFSITGKAAAKKAVNATESKTPNIGSLEQKNESTVPNSEQKTEKKENTSIPGFEIIYGIIGLLGVFLQKRR
jgi:PGF-pre-PGF domain-containing protein